MQVFIIVATFVGESQPVAPVIAVGATFRLAEQVVNIRLARRTESWMYLSLPDHETSVIRSTPIGQIRFDMEVHDV